ncbi:MAG TPA: hypothetical protein VGQ33_05620 [Vicinamibacteria bacterium]|nr:hypothetical protein [Vicinamibacteria bacterium]
MAVRTAERPRVTITRPPAGAPVEMVRALEAAVLAALGDTTEPLDVQFSTCLAEDGRLQFVCRVEGPPADPFGGPAQWRWWSAIFDDPQALQESLSAASRRRAGSRPGATGASAS